MTLTPPRSHAAQRALSQLQALRDELITALRDAASVLGPPPDPTRHAWLRDGGAHGGGDRLGFAATAAFNRATANISCVHYDDLPEKRLASATALSCIIHPAPPAAPSMHLHTSLTELRDGAASWRIMADLNPSQPEEPEAQHFRHALTDAAPTLATRAFAEGDRYFFIPALGRHRGVVHFYLEGHATPSPEADAQLAARVTRAAIHTYAHILRSRLTLPPTAESLRHQLRYHTLYAFQVLTLDRGTTSGLLVHNQNDAGILGSLPSHLDAALLASWRPRMPQAQQPLLDALTGALPDPAPDGRTALDADARLRLAEAIRGFYREHPAALELQARGSVVPPTVANHAASR